MPSSNERTREIDTSRLSRKWRKRLRKTPKPPLSKTHPEVASEWHPRKNKGLSPDDLTYGSKTKVWWLCEVHPSHEWETSPNCRCKANGEPRTGCPFCDGKKVCVTNSLASLFPEMAAEWHPSKNKGLTPHDVTGKSRKAVWWQCIQDKTHVWQRAVSGRTMTDTRCPFCCNRRISKTNNLAARFPKIAAEWHPKKNGKLTAKEVVPGTLQSIWWQCRKEPQHEWQATPSDRVTYGGTCQFCSGRKPSKKNNLFECYPEIAAEWHPRKNGKLTAKDVLPSSSTYAWWRCKENPRHTWLTQVVNRTRQGTRCPVCAYASRKTSSDVSSKYNIAKLFPELAKQWHAELNEDLKPKDVPPHSNKKIWWQCAKEPEHIWSALVVSRTKGKTGCPFCANSKVSKTNNLEFLYPEIALEWHATKNGDMKPNQVVAGSTKKIWWQCTKNKKHVYLKMVRKRTNYRQNCPQCPKT